MEIVKKYVTSDKQEFNNKADALNHEVFLESAQAIRTALEPAYQTGRAESVVKSMLIDADAIRAILTNHLRRTKKPKTA